MEMGTAAPPIAAPPPMDFSAGILPPEELLALSLFDNSLVRR